MSAGLPRTQVVMLAGVFGISLGLFAIYVDFGSWDQPTRDFASSGAFLFWVALLSAQTMLWTVALAPLLTTFRRQWRAREPQSLRREVIPSAVILASFVAALVILPRAGGKLPEIIPHHHLKIDILTAVALVVALVAATSIWLIRGRAEALGRKKTFAKNDLNSYLGLRSDLDGLPGLPRCRDWAGRTCLGSTAAPFPALRRDDRLPRRKRRPLRPRSLAACRLHLPADVSHCAASR